MVDKARARNVYDRLDTGDLVAALRDGPAEEWDLLTAADVLIYIGDLSPFFEAAAHALRPGGAAVFTLEAGTTDRYHLHTKTLRYTHAKAYVDHVTAIHGLVAERIEDATLRHEGDRPVAGYVITVRRP
jgi:predicted TPR repeat methyltransferase